MPSVNDLVGVWAMMYAAVVIGPLVKNERGFLLVVLGAVTMAVVGRGWCASPDTGGGCAAYVDEVLRGAGAGALIWVMSWVPVVLFKWVARRVL